MRKRAGTVSCNKLVSSGRSALDDRQKLHEKKNTPYNIPEMGIPRIKLQCSI